MLSKSIILWQSQQKNNTWRRFYLNNSKHYSQCSQICKESWLSMISPRISLSSWRGNLLTQYYLYPHLSRKKKLEIYMNKYSIVPFPPGKVTLPNVFKELFMTKLGRQSLWISRIKISGNISDLIFHSFVEMPKRYVGYINHKSLSSFSLSLRTLLSLTKTPSLI